MGWIPVVALAVLMAAVVAVPQSALADDHEPWRDEIDFELTEPVEGRRIFVEGLTVSGDRAAVTLRAATELDIRVRAFGGPEGAWLRFWGSATLAEGERIDYSLPLNGPRAVLHRLVGGHPRPGRGADLRGSAEYPVSACQPSRENCATFAYDLPGLDARSRQRRGRIGVRDAHRAPGRASDGGRARERHRDGAHGRRGDSHHGDGLRSDRRVPRGASPFVPDAETRFTAARSERDGQADSRRERGR